MRRFPHSRLVASVAAVLLSAPVLTCAADGSTVDVPPGQVLPTSDLDLPLPNLPTVAGREPTTPAVQAIPTPSALPTGLALLGIVFVARRWIIRNAC